MVSHSFNDNSNRVFSVHRESFYSDMYKLRNYLMWSIPLIVLSQRSGVKPLDFLECEFEYR